MNKEVVGGGGRRRENREGEEQEEEATREGGDEGEDTVAFAPENEVKPDAKVVGAMKKEIVTFSLLSPHFQRKYKLFQILQHHNIFSCNVVKHQLSFFLWVLQKNPNFRGFRQKNSKK